VAELAHTVSLVPARLGCDGNRVRVDVGTGWRRCGDDTVIFGRTICVNPFKVDPKATKKILALRTYRKGICPICKSRCSETGLLTTLELTPKPQLMLPSNSALSAEFGSASVLFARTTRGRE
jgi:hypothetical protein